MSRPLILAVEDEEALARFLKTSLERAGYQIIQAATATEAISLARSHNPDLVLLDLGLPDRDGLDVLADFRMWSAAPVIVLSARFQEQQKVMALDANADDFVTKHFGMTELTARIRRALKRADRRSASQGLVKTGDLEIDLEAHAVTRAGKDIKLTPLEHRLLAALVRREGKVATHQQLLTEVWGPGQAEQTQYLHVYMRNLRHKMEEDPIRPRYLVTEVGVGYRLAID